MLNVLYFERPRHIRRQLTRTQLLILTRCSYTVVTCEIKHWQKCCKMLVFYYRASAYLAMQSRILATVRMSVSPSVCLSVHPSVTRENDAS